MKKFTLLLLLSLLAFCPWAKAQLSITGSGSYTQNFNTLPASGTLTWADNVTLPGWYVNKQGTGAVTLSAAPGGSSTTGIFNLGTAALPSDRALGALPGTNTGGAVAFGVQFQNTTGGPIAMGVLSYVGEQYRYSGGANNTNTIWYRTSANPIATLSVMDNSAWTALPALNFTNPITTANASGLGLSNPATSLNGNVAPFRTVVSADLSGIVLAPSVYIMFRLLDIDESGTDHTLGMDDFSLSYSAVTVSMAPAITQQPVAATVTVGDTVTFTVVATGTPAPTYQWRKGGTAIPGATDATLTITNAQPADAGSYDVVVTNSQGGATSDAATLTISAPPPVSPVAYYADPATGSMGNSGTSLAAPWSTLQAVFAAGKTFAPGDTIYLLTGDHGFPVITGDNTDDVTITKYAGNDPVVNRIDFDGATHWVLDGIKVHSEDAPPSPPILVHPVPAIYENTLLRITNTSSAITVKNCTIYSIDDSSSWTADDWNYKAWTGIYIHNSSHHIVIDACDVKNVAFGIHMNATTHHLIIKNCQVHNFCGDGLRANCDDLNIENNVIHDVYATSGNHYDMIQGFASARVVIRGNILLNTTSNRPLIAEAQGLGGFDGWFDDWIVENNLIATGHWNSLTMLGARNCRIVNNTVVKNPFSNSGMTPWIQIGANKDGTPSTGNIVRNNLTASFNNSAGIGTVDYNVVSTDYASFFVDYPGLNFHLKAGTAAVDGGTSDLSPSVDIEGTPRVAPVDVGAYELPGGVPAVAPPVFLPQPGTYTEVQAVTLSSATAGASIRYTIDGGIPTPTFGTPYTGPITVGSNMTIKAVAYGAGGGLADSLVRTAVYIINSSTSVTATPSDGFYTTPLAAAQSGSFTVQYDATPSISPIDAVVGLAFGTPTAYTGLAAIARFSSTGVIDAYNGAGYAAASSIPYSAGAAYHFRLVVNVTAHTYSVFVTPPGGSELEVGSNYAFRSSQASVTSLQNWVVSVLASPGGSITVNNFTLEAALSAPVITTQPASAMVNEGASVAFSIGATGSPVPTYQWRKGGSALPGATGPSLSLASAQLSDAGSYDVVVTNSEGSVTSNAATLVVNSLILIAPVITQQPASVIVAVGAPASFSVNASGTPAPAYQWRKGGSAIGGATGATYTIARTQPTDSGSYDVVVSNSAGAVTSNPAVLSLSGGGSGFGISLAASGVYTQNFNALPASGTLTWADNATVPGWYINKQGTGAVTISVAPGGSNTTGIFNLGTAALPGDRALGALPGTNTGGAVAFGVLFQNTGSAPMTLGVLSYAGEQYRYSGAANNTNTMWYQISASPITTLSVTDNSAWTALPALNFTNPITTANASGLGLPNPATSLNGNAAPFRTVLSADLSRIVLAPGEHIMFRLLDIDNSGTDHTLGMDDFSLSYDAVVAIAPVITAQPANQVVTAGSTVSFTIVATGTPAPTYQWRKDGAAISGATTATLAITGVQTADAGNYDVLVTNTAGSVTSDTVMLAVNKVAADIVLSGLDQVYDGTSREVTAATAPAGLAIAITYDGATAAPTAAGSYAVAATIVDPIYEGMASSTLVVVKAGVTVTLGNLSNSYDGTAKIASVATSPAGLTVTVTYDGSGAAPTAAGSYSVFARVAELNYEGTSAGTLVISQAAAAVMLDGLWQRYSGTPKTVTADTNPEGIPVRVTYDGGTAAPTYPGLYAVVATTDSPNYAGMASGTLFIDTTALVRHAPTLNGGVDGSIQMLAGESTTLNGSAWVSSDLLVPGTPTIQLNGHPYYTGTLDSSGSPAPTNYKVTLNGNALLPHVIRRVDPATMPTIAAPPAPAGTVNVTINNTSQSVDNWSTTRNVTLNGNVGLVAVPAGTYGSFTANGSSGFILGVVGGVEPAVYNLEGLVLNGSSHLDIVGPVVLTLASGVSANGSMGNATHPEWLLVRFASGGLTLNGSVTVSGTIIAPSGTVTINGNTTLRGQVSADRLTLNGNGRLEDPNP